MPNKQVLIRMPEPLHTALKERAEADGISLSQLMNQISQQHLINLKTKSFESQTNKHLDNDGLSNTNYEPFANISEAETENLGSSVFSSENTTVIQRLRFLENQVLLLKHQVLGLISTIEANSTLSETHLANYQATTAFSQPGSSSHLAQVLPLTSYCADEADRRWLCLDEAYATAQQQGYSHSLLAFKMLITCLKNPNSAYQQYQLV